MKKHKILTATMVLAMLVLSACGQNVTPADTNERSNSTSTITTEIITDGTTDTSVSDETTTMIDPPTIEDITEKMRLFDLMSTAEKAEYGYENFKKLTDAEYDSVNSKHLTDLDLHTQDIIAAVAKAYYNQSYTTRLTGTSKGTPQILYDQYNNRRNVNATPEDATSQKNLYLDCSSFVSSVYYYTFGINLLDGKGVTTKSLNTEFAAKTPDKDSELMYYITGAELAELQTNTAKAVEKIAEIKAALQPGDIINYRRTTDSGHVIMYLGNNKIIHSIGSANTKTSLGTVDPKTSVEKNTADEKAFGTICIDNWDLFFTQSVTPKSQNDGRISTSNRYLFASGISAIAIFRPTNAKDGRMKNQPITSAAIDRYLYQEMDIEKTADITHNGKTDLLLYGNSCYAGDEITYTVTIRNNSSKAMKSLTCTEALPTQLEYVSSCTGSVYFSDERKVCLHIATLEAGQTVEFSYTLKVKSGLAAGKVIKDSNTYVNNIKTNALVNQYCAYEISTSQLESAINSAVGLNYDDCIAAAKAIYSTLGGNESFAALKAQGSPKDVLELFLRADILRNGAANGYMVVRTLYGGYKVGAAEIVTANESSDYENFNLRARRVMKNYLEDGDIIVTYSAYLKEYNAIIYCNDALYGMLSDGTLGRISSSSLSSGATGSIQDYLDTLTAYNDFLVLRPALLG